MQSRSGTATSDWRKAATRVDLLTFEPSSLDPKATSSEGQGSRYASLDWAMSAPAGLATAIRSRIASPGGYYNLGNALGLVMGITVQIVAAKRGSNLNGGALLYDYFAGSGAALALTLTTLVFFCSGEVYHRAWARDKAPDQTLNRLGDLLSGIGAIGLGIALFLSGEPLLAATSGLLHALGKFGSAFHQAEEPAWGWPKGWPDPFRSAVLASRLPAMAAAALGSVAALRMVWSGASATLVATPLTLLVCYLLWAKADLLLFRSSAPESPPPGKTASR